MVFVFLYFTSILISQLCMYVCYVFIKYHSINQVMLAREYDALRRAEPIHCSNIVLNHATISPARLLFHT